MTVGIYLTLKASNFLTFPNMVKNILSQKSILYVNSNWAENCLKTITGEKKTDFLCNVGQKLLL